MAKRLGRSKSFKQLRKVTVTTEQVDLYQDQNQGDQRPSTSNGTPENGYQTSISNGSLTKKVTVGTMSDLASSSSSSMSQPWITNKPLEKRNWAELTATGEPIILSTEEDIFKFPTPGPTRKMPVFSPVARSFGVLSETSSGIGVALGSPSQPSYFSPTTSSRWADSSQDVSMPVSPLPVRANTTKERNDMMEGSRPKLSRWRSLGGFFGRKRSTNTRQLNGDSKSNDMMDSQDQQRSGSKKVVLVGGTTSASGSSTDIQSPKTLRKTKKSVKGREGVTVTTTWVSSPDLYETPGAPKFPTREPLLDVQIPDITLERYSVMFSDVLPRSSSLLARRQAALDRSVPLGGASLKVGQAVFLCVAKILTPQC
jgi:hypothetical protein